MREETGLAVDHPPAGPVLVHVDVHAVGRDHVHLDLRYLVVGPDADPSPGPGESQEVAWFAWDRRQSMADVALAGALRTARRLIGPRDGGIPGRGHRGEAMAEPFDTLLAVQEHDTTLDQLRHRMETLPGAGGSG